MKEKIRNSIIEMSKSRDISIKMFLMIISFIIIACLIMCTGLQFIWPLAVVMLVLAVIVFWCWECLNAVGKADYSIIRRNKIINIILADEDVWKITIPIIICLISLIAFILISSGSVSGKIFFAIWIAIVLVGSAILGKVLPQIFKKRLK